MTQKDKIIEARMFALSMKSLADRLMYDGKDYDVQFARNYAKEIKSKAEDLLKKV